jgi:hypothetical protein
MAGTGTCTKLVQKPFSMVLNARISVLTKFGFKNNNTESTIIPYIDFFNFGRIRNKTIEANSN